MKTMDRPTERPILYDTANDLSKETREAVITLVNVSRMSWT